MLKNKKKLFAKRVICIVYVSVSIIDYHESRFCIVHELIKIFQFPYLEKQNYLNVNINCRNMQSNLRGPPFFLQRLLINVNDFNACNGGIVILGGEG